MGICGYALRDTSYAWHRPGPGGGILSGMPEATVIALLVAFPLLGALMRRWPVVALPLIAWPIYYAGLHRGWWFYGTGDGWQIGAVFYTVVGVASTALTVFVARSRKPPRDAARFAKPS
jgi:hypothetical protein